MQKHKEMTHENIEFNEIDYIDSCRELLNIYMKEYISEYNEDNVDITDFVNCVMDNIPVAFFFAPSSTSLEYHPIEDNIVGGLFLHSIKSFVVGKHLRFGFMSPEERAGVFSDNPDDLMTLDDVMVAMILHDGTAPKYENGEWVTDYEHGITMYNLIIDVYEQNEFPTIPAERIERIATMVRCHMDQWAKPKEESDYVNKVSNDRTSDMYLDIKSTQQADYIASRPELSFFPLADTGRYIRERRNASIFDKICDSDNNVMTLFDHYMETMSSIYDSNFTKKDKLY